MATGDRNNSQPGRPDNLPEFWDFVFDNLPGAFWSSKGLSGTCPHCNSESTANKQVFLVRFEDGQFNGFSCFKCPFFGGRHGGVQKLLRQMGLPYDTVKVGDMTQVAELSYRGSVDDIETVEEIAWPPPWVVETDAIRERGLAYLRDKRGIIKPGSTEDVVARYELVFSEVVEVVIKKERYVRPYPCVVFPMAGEGGRIIGWTTRRLGDNPENPSEPKSIAMTGSGWKKESLLGLREVDPKKPISVVEGPLSMLSTPNSVGLGGKVMSSGQIGLLADTMARVYIFSLDPEVTERTYTPSMRRLQMDAPGSRVYAVNWEKVSLALNKADHRWQERDPNDRGFDEMLRIVRMTIADNTES